MILASRVSRAAAAALAAFTLPLVALAGPTGHPLIHPFEGSKLVSSKLVEYDEYDLPVGKSEKGKAPLQHLEGKITTLNYQNPPNRSAFEIWHNYEAAFREAGFQTVFSCKGKDCGGWMQLKWIGGYPKSDDGRYAAFKIARGGGETWVALGVSPVNVELAIVEPKEMETGRVTVDAAALANGIDREGHVAVYGIHFDTGKADLKAESQSELAEIAALMKKSPALKLHVVGHTDNQGDLPSNMDLSKRRAAAVVAALTKAHGIAADRLHAEGVGPLSPVATNRTEEGRARNRRVDLVQQ